jgi:hypothetical protein
VRKIELISHSDSCPFIVVFGVLLFEVKVVSVRKVADPLVLLIAIIGKPLFSWYKNVVIMVHDRYLAVGFTS